MPIAIYCLICYGFFASNTYVFFYSPQLEARAEAAEAGAALAEGLPALMTGAAALAAAIQQEQGLDAGEASMSGQLGSYEPVLS